MSNEYEVETADAGAAQYLPVQTSTCKKGGYILIKDQPCKIESISTSKPGKHGSAKCHIFARNVFTNKTMEEISPAHGTVKQPITKRDEYAVVDMADDGYLTLMNDLGEVREDIQVPEGEHKEKIKTFLDRMVSAQVTVFSVMGQEKIEAVKEESQK